MKGKDMKPQNDTKEILEKALAELEKRGWCKGAPQNSQGQMCVIGAINQVSHGHPWLREKDYPAIKALRAAVPKKYADDWPADYNNRPGINFSHIRAWFKRAIEAAA